MKKLFITLFICICVVVTVTIITRTDLFNKKSTSKTTEKNYDILKMLEYNKNISNIYVEIELSDGTLTKIYIKDDMKKLVSDDTIGITNTQQNSTTAYKVNDNKGIIYNENYDIFKTFFNSDYIIYDENKYEYVIENEIINKNNYIKVIAINKLSNNVSFVVWFDAETNLIFKTQERQDSNNYILYKNIKLNCVTDDDFKIPNNISLKKVNIKN